MGDKGAKKCYSRLVVLVSVPECFCGLSSCFLVLPCAFVFLTGIILLVLRSDMSRISSDMYVCSEFVFHCDSSSSMSFEFVLRWVLLGTSYDLLRKI